LDSKEEETVLYIWNRVGEGRIGRERIGKAEKLGREVKVGKGRKGEVKTVRIGKRMEEWGFWEGTAAEGLLAKAGKRS
jgi:hypothetical protein